MSEAQAVWYRGSFTRLLAAMRLLLVVAPLLRGSEVAGLLVPALFFLVIGAGALAVSRDRGLSLVLAGGVVLAIGIRLWSASSGHFFNAVLLLSLAAVMLSGMLRSQRVTSDTVVGGICVYLLVGVAFSQAFAGVGNVVETAFRSEEPLVEADYLYFSFVTLTTLGYGDIVPVDRLVRTLAVLEALLGPLYLAILIARLVGLRLQGGGSDGDDAPV